MCLILFLNNVGFAISDVFEMVIYVESTNKSLVTLQIPDV